MNALTSDPFYCLSVIGFAIGAAPFLWIRGRQAWRARSAPAWEIAVATIHSVDIPVKPHGNIKCVHISYSYFVNEYQSGEHSIFLNEVLAYEVARLLKNETISVRYDPRNPSVSSVADQDILKAADEAGAREKLHEIPSPTEMQFNTAIYSATRKLDR